MVCGLACQLEASKIVHGRVVLICCWSPESGESGGMISTAASLPHAHPALLLHHSQGGKSQLGWHDGAVSKSTGDAGGRQACCWALSPTVGSPCWKPKAWCHVFDVLGTPSANGGSHFQKPLSFSWADLCYLYLILLAVRHTAVILGAPGGTSQVPTCSHTVGPVLSNSISPAFPPSFALQAPPMNY